MFPQGGPGVALLLLRLSVGAGFYGSATKLVDLSSTWLLFAWALLVFVSLGLGFLTPYLSVIACAAGVAKLVIGPYSRDLYHVLPVLDAAALAFLGPGAYSVDARLFGRRVTVVPPRKDTDRP